MLRFGVLVCWLCVLGLRSFWSCTSVGLEAAFASSRIEGCRLRTGRTFVGLSCRQVSPWPDLICLPLFGLGLLQGFWFRVQAGL